jgi:hypothetical protein|tara:strand:+ start:1423 stop:1719 length:297 start_codon:yes stop_codon:yes gene_type:complete
MKRVPISLVAVTLCTVVCLCFAPGCGTADKPDNGNTGAVQQQSSTAPVKPSQEAIKPDEAEVFIDQTPTLPTQATRANVNQSTATPIQVQRARTIKAI